MPTINLGSRQKNRVNKNVINTIDFNEDLILNAINNSITQNQKVINVDFGDGNSDKKFFSILQSDEIWNISNQKVFNDL